MFSSDLSPVEDLVQYAASAERLRRFASRLKSNAETAMPLVNRLWRLGGYNPGGAADLLMHYAYSFDPTERRQLRPGLEKALRFALWPERPVAESQQVA